MAERPTLLWERERIGFRRRLHMLPQSPNRMIDRNVPISSWGTLAVRRENVYDKLAIEARSLVGSRTVTLSPTLARSVDRACLQFLKGAGLDCASSHTLLSSRSNLLRAIAGGLAHRRKRANA